MAGISDLIAQAAQRYGQAPGVLTRIGQLESGLRPGVKNPRSSAGGLFQFIDSTAAQYGLANRYDPNAAADAGARLLRDNAALLTSRLGRPPTGPELYLAHQQGGGGASKILANPGGDAAATVGAKAVTLNGGRLGMTNGQFANLWANKFNGAKGTAMTMPPGTNGTYAGPQVGTGVPSMVGAPISQELGDAVAAMGRGNATAVLATAALQPMQDFALRQQREEEEARERKRALYGERGGALAGLYG